MAQTLDQKRAQFAWDAVNEAKREVAKFSDYKNLTKGAPALIMGNGLMAALAFYQSRGKNHTTQLVKHILGWFWLASSQGQNGVPPFTAAMTAFQGMDSRDYMRATEETLAMLKWLRQFADAVEVNQ